MAVKTQLYLCDVRVQGVSVCTNVLANYMFRPLPVRPPLPPRPPPTNYTGTPSPVRSLPVMDKLVTADYWQQCIYFNTTSLHTCPKFCKWDLVPSWL